MTSSRAPIRSNSVFSLLTGNFNLRDEFARDCPTIRPSCASRLASGPRDREPGDRQMAARGGEGARTREHRRDSGRTASDRESAVAAGADALRRPQRSLASEASFTTDRRPAAPAVVLRCLRRRRVVSDLQHQRIVELCQELRLSAMPNLYSTTRTSPARRRLRNSDSTQRS